MKPIKNILIVGGGTSGLVAALILQKRFSKIKIHLVKSNKIGIIGVGEGSTEHFGEFLNFTGITPKMLIQGADATLKYGVVFENWTKETYFHNVTNGISSLVFGQYLSGYAHSIVNNFKPKKYTNGFCLDDMVLSNPYPNQYHFNTFKLNDFLIERCKLVGVKIFEDEIKDVIVKDGKINYLKGEKKKYKYDFYIDSTGFKKLLISKLGAKWNSYKDYLPMNEAIAFPTKDTEEYAPYTLSRAMKAGWMWRIPTYGRWGNGYVFNNNYINKDEAQQECEKYLGHKIKIGKNIKFEAGALDKAWIGNCVAVGLSSSFMEPLEASSIGTSIQQAFLLMHLLPFHSEKDISLYNQRFSSIVENIRDFVQLHYVVNKKDSKFWKELKLNLTDTLKYNLEKWKHRLPIREDFLGGYKLFNENNFTIILKELGLFNNEKIKYTHDSLSADLKGDTFNLIRDFIRDNENGFTFTKHKKFLDKIRKT